MADWVERMIGERGYVAVVLLTCLENVFPPIPSEVVIPYAGFVASREELTLWGVILAACLGSVLGALPLYYLGYWLSLDRLEAWAGRHGRVLGALAFPSGRRSPLP